MIDPKLLRTSLEEVAANLARRRRTEIHMSEPFPDPRVAMALSFESQGARGR